MTVALVTSVTWFSAAAQTPAGNIKDGEKKVAMCIGCHGIIGYQASFPEIHKVPMIAGQGAKYIMAALTAYQKGERRHPTMRGIAQGLSEQDMADLGAFYEASGGPAANGDAPAPTPPAPVAELLKKGNCASCHGENLNKPIDPSYPKLAGQHGDYTEAQLVAFRSGARGNNPQMAAIAGKMNDREIKAVADYIAGLR